MDKLIYLIYPIMIIILFAGAKVCKRKEWNEEFMSLSQTKALQGFFAICIMLHHAGQKTCASWKPAPFIVHGLDFFVPIGYFFVGIFLFCSGYGLFKSFTQKEDYLRGFGKRRILPLVLAFYSTAIIFFIVRLIMGERMRPSKVICYLSGAMLCNPNAWFVIVLPIFYLVFYLAFRHIKKADAALAVTCLMVFVYTVIGTFIDHNDYWMKGEWWYNSVHLFSIGLIFARFEKPLMAHLKKYYAVYLILMIVGLAVLYPFSEYAQTAFSYYGQNWGAPDKVPRRWVCLLSQAGAACAFVFLVFLLNMKIRIGNRILKFMGTITMEFYLIHGLFVELFGYSFLDLRATMGYVRGYYIRNVALYLVVVTILSVPAACLLQKLHKKILG